MNIRTAFAGVVLAPLLAACGGSSSDGQDRSFSTVQQLHDAAVAAGYPCDGWVVDNKEKLAAQSGHCGDVDRFETFATKADLQAQLAADRKSDQLTIEAGFKPSQIESRLVGPNWLIAGPVETIGDKLGGTLVVPKG